MKMKLTLICLLSTAMIAVAFARSPPEPPKIRHHIPTIYDDQYDLENVNPHLYDDEFLGNTDLDDLIEIMIEEIDSLIKKFTGRRK
jgi:predicted CoA-binding protein